MTACAIDFDDEPTAVIRTLGALVREPALVIDERAPLAEARRLLAESRVPALVVVDASDAVRGLITRSDLLAARDDGRVLDAMSGCVFALRASAEVHAAAALIAYEGVGQVVVIDAAGQLVGMVSAIDLVRYYAG
ncbi:MAG TPA: CBS domain-containing protein [Kofleriaceae bacterium]|nr:CBS domain-containing protein [Kofleriaceae bacterium]